MRPRLLQSLLIALAAFLLCPVTALADLPVGYVGPDWFSDPTNVRGGSQWKLDYIGATPPIDPSLYGTDPDASGHDQHFTFTDADNSAGTVSTGLSLWPVGYTRDPVPENTRAVVGGSPFMLAVQRRRVVDDDFEVFALDFAGADKLQGSYYTCGPRAFAKNPDKSPNYGAPFYDPFYAEGTVVAQRGANPPAPSPALTSPDEMYGYFGLWGGESPLCDQARNTPSLWSAGTTGTPPPAANRRETRTDVICNRGPNPGDPFACTATFYDTDLRPTASPPLGTATLTATAGTLDHATCAPAASSASASTCTFVYTNPTLGAGNAPPLSVAYQGSGNHVPSSGVPVAQVGSETTKGPQPAGPAPIVCGAAPLPACAGTVPQVDPVQTCVANTGGACINTSTGPQPIQVCLGNIVTACEGFAAGAQFVGEIKPQGGGAATLSCPAGADLPTSGPRATPQPTTVVDYDPPCRIQARLEADEKLITSLYDQQFRQQVEIRFAIAFKIKRLDPLVRSKPHLYNLREVISDTGLQLMADYNQQSAVVNRTIEPLSSVIRGRLGLAILKPIRFTDKLDEFLPYALGPGGVGYADPRFKTLPGGYDLGLGPRARTRAAKRSRKVVSSRKPERKAITAPVSLVVARSAQTTVAAGATKRVKLTTTRFGRALLGYYLKKRQRRPRLTASVTIGVGSNVATARKSVPVSLKADKRKAKRKKTNRKR